MNEIKVFEKEEFGKIRTIVIDNTVWFIGKDVAEALGYSNTKDALIKHIDKEDKKILKGSDLRPLENHIPKSVSSADFVSSDIPNRGFTIINESGVYALIFGSKLESAKEFKHWVTSEILPSIRKTGSYSVQKISNEDLMAIVVQTNNQIANICASMNKQLKATTNQTQENTARIEKLEKELEQKKVEVAPDLPPKEHIIALVRNHADKTKETDYAKLYRQLYSDYGLRTHTNPSAKAKKSNMTTIAFIEKEGDIKLLLSIAEKLFGVGLTK